MNCSNIKQGARTLRPGEDATKGPKAPVERDAKGPPDCGGGSAGVRVCQDSWEWTLTMGESPGLESTPHRSRLKEESEGKPDKSQNRHCVARPTWGRRLGVSASCSPDGHGRKRPGGLRGSSAELSSRAFQTPRRAGTQKGLPSPPPRL